MYTNYVDTLPLHALYNYYIYDLYIADRARDPSIPQELVADLDRRLAAIAVNHPHVVNSSGQKPKLDRAIRRRAIGADFRVTSSPCSVACSQYVHVYSISYIVIVMLVEYFHIIRELKGFFIYIHNFNVPSKPL